LSLELATIPWLLGFLDKRGYLATSSIRVLVVDDYEPFRRFACSTLERSPSLQIIGEASDGLEAVQKAEQLQPDLVVLDIGLPTLNGIEAARRIRKLCPASRILFVSQESSAEVVQEALSTGALGYVIKAHAGSELVAAVEAVCQGRRFVSSGLAGHDFTGASDAGSEGLRSNGASAPLQQSTKSARCHRVLFYSDDRGFLDDLTQFIGAALKGGGAAIVVATESYRDSLIPRLQAHGLNIGAAIEQRRYIYLDAADTLSAFMVNGMPDRARFLKVAGDLIAEAAKPLRGERARVVACGQCAPLLWAQGNAEAVLRLEHLWDEIAELYDVDILCGYPLGSFQGGMGRYIFDKLCGAHSAVHSQ
jgi:DNA-binding NarL/FixJ family response regulator